MPHKNFDAVIERIEAVSKIFNLPSSDYALLTPEEVSLILGIPKGTLATWRSTKRHPLPYKKLGGAVRYTTTDIQTFLESMDAK